MDKFEIIKNFLLDENISPEIRRERFEIAWDIKENFDKVLEKLAYKNFINPLIEKLKPILGDFIITQTYSSAIYIAKPHWKQNIKDRGIIAIGLERWNNNRTEIGLIKNTDKETSPFEEEIKQLLTRKYGLKPTRWWLGYLPDERKLPTTKLPLREYYLQILLNPKRVIEEHFLALKEVLDIANDKEISQLLEKIVKERKKQTL